MSRRPFRRVTFQLNLFRQINKNFFAQAICFSFSKPLENGKSPNCLKLANITPAFKKVYVHQKITVDHLVFSLFLQWYLKGCLVDNIKSSLIIYYLNFNVVLERVMELNIDYYWCLKFLSELLTIIKPSVHY